MLYEKFGEFDSAEEINKSAEGLKAEGDTESLLALAKENGIDEDDVYDYLDDVVDELCNPLMAAMGKLQVEADDLKPYEIMDDWIEYIKFRCQERDEIARAVRKKGKSLKGCIGALLQWSFKNAQPVDKDIVKAAGVSGGSVKLGIPGIGRAGKIITDYYLGE